jgi:hypothetical protein
MNLDVVPDNVLERVAMALGIVPAPVVRVLWGVAVTRVVLPALDFGVFDAIDAGAVTVDDIATKTGCDKDGMRSLLAALNGFGYLRRGKGRYSLAPATKKWITSNSKTSMRSALEFAATLDEMMARIPDAVRTGRRGGLHEEPHPPEWWRRYMEGLGAVSKLTGSELARRVKLKAPKRLLDVGGGHGMYSVAFCRRHPDLMATVLDLPEAANVGRSIVEREGFAERVRYQHGDLRTSVWGAGFDVVLLFNILHNLTAEDALAALKRARAALAPGGEGCGNSSWSRHSCEIDKVAFAEGFADFFGALWMWDHLSTGPCRNIPREGGLSIEAPGPFCVAGIDNQRPMCNARGLWDVIDNYSGDDDGGFATFASVIRTLRFYPRNCFCSDFNNHCANEGDPWSGCDYNMCANNFVDFGENWISLYGNGWVPFFNTIMNGNGLQAACAN